MTLCARLLLILCAAAAQGCLDSSLVLHVKADRSGRAVLTSRVYTRGIQAFDSLFPDSPPKKVPTLDELLPAPMPGGVDRVFGTPVRLVSTTVDVSADGGTRTTTVDFDDIRMVRLMFPPDISTPGHVFFSASGVGEGNTPITFSIRRHDNGDELLMVKMPDPPVLQDNPGNAPITTFETDSAEERAFKQAIKGLAIRFIVDLDQPLLRTNAPKMSDSGATILDLDMDRMINAMDEAKARRLLSANSFQEVLWQLGDLPGAAIPVDHEVFLEYQAPQPARQPTAQPATPPDTEIYLLPMKIAATAITLGAPANITNNPGYDNQPFFTPDGRSILFTSIRGSGSQSDIYRYDISTAQTTQITNTPESEYSPTVTPSGAVSVVRVEQDADKTQRLWQFTADGRDPRVILPDVKPVGYHAWADDHTLALYILGGQGAPATLQLADTRTGKARVVATDVGRSVQRMPGTGDVRHVSFVQRERTADSVTWVVKELDSATGAVTALAPAIDAGSTDLDTGWAPDGTLFAARAGKLYAWRSQTGWKEVASLEQMGLAGVTRLAISPRGNWLAVVAAPQTSR